VRRDSEAAGQLVRVRRSRDGGREPMELVAPGRLMWHPDPAPRSGAAPTDGGFP